MSHQLGEHGPTIAEAGMVVLSIKVVQGPFDHRNLLSTREADKPRLSASGVGHMGTETRRILERTKKGLRPPSQSELDHAMAKWLFGENADKIMARAPWSFVLLKLMWKKGEEPWEE